MTPKTPALGRLVADRRQMLGLSLKDLGRLVHKEDGQGVSAQYLHDIERDRRTPSPQVLGELARALGLDEHYVAAVAGQLPVAIVAYLRERPECASAVVALFTRASAADFSDWESVRLQTPAAEAHTAKG